MKIFETEQDLKREERAINTFVNVFQGSFQKLGPLDIDYKVFDKEGNLLAYAEVKGRLKTMKTAYPLPVSLSKLSKLIDKRLNPVLIWSCDDGIIYGKVFSLVGQVKYGGRPPREGASNDNEMMVYFDQQKDLKYIRFT
jgi:hypothetical protein